MRTIVKAGDYAVGRATGTLAAIGLGSCVAIVLYDPTTRIGGLAHALLPECPTSMQAVGNRMRFAATGVGALAERLVAAGATRASLEARLVGGASMFRELMARGSPQVGERNVTVARRALADEGIPLIGEEVGGERGRTVEFELSDGSVRVSSVSGESIVV